MPNASVRFRILGPLEINIDGRPVELRAGRQQTVLSMLLLEANNVVSSDRLVDALWGDDPPSTASGQIQICVSALRRVLAGADGTIETRAPGYRIRIEPGQLDMRVFENAVSEAWSLYPTGAVAPAVARLREALALWSGSALSSVTSRVVQAKAARLNENYLGVYEDCVDWELQLGRHHDLISELMSLVSQNPLRERLCRQLMLALYRSGRQAEALEAYRDTRTELVEQLGIEPGEELVRLEAAILAHDTALDWADEADTASGPRQLIASTGDFTGRTEHVASMERALLGSDTAAGSDGVVPIVVIAGKSGVGKSALAIHMAHRLAPAHFPDVQLYADLRGTQPDPVPNGELLMRFLRALSPPGANLPDTVEERAQLYRSRLAGQRALIVLDNANDEAQVRPLLPGSAGCAVIITSSARLTGFPGCRLVDLREFGHDEAVELLGRVIGEERVRAAPAAARVLSDFVGGLPLALRVVGARLAARPHWTLETMVRRLTDERQRLDELVHGDLAVRASISLTYNSLPPMAQRLFRALSELPGDAFPAWVAAAVLDVDVREAEDLLDVLVDAQLLDFVALEASGAISYRFHALIRIFARERLPGDRADGERHRAALERVCSGWLTLSEHAHGQLYGGQFTLLHGTAPRWEPRGGFQEIPMHDPLAWLESERVNLMAAVRQSAAADLSELTWDLAMTLVTLFEARGYFDDWAETHKFALASVREHDNRRGIAAILTSLGSLYVSKRETATAIEVLDRAMELFVELGDRHGRALVLRSLASIDYHMGAPRPAMERYEEALLELRHVGDLIGVAHVLVNLAQLQMDDGAPDLAVKQLDEALDICRSVGSRRTEAQVLYRLGLAQLEQGRVDRARESLTAVLQLVRQNDDQVGESYARLGLSAVHARLGNLDTAQSLLRRTLAICEELADTVGRGRALFELGGLLAQGGDDEAARRHLSQALAIFREQRLRLWENRTLDVLSTLPE